MAKKKKEEQEVIVENIISNPLDDLMGEKYAIYAKEVIQDRAIPDARDGLKPVQRRIIFDMWNTNNTYDHPTKKCAHIVGDVMGKYHPHGDSSIYEALVHMGQQWAYRYPLVDFQGNNGSIDGDGPAAMRYTEARLSALSDQLVADIDKETVDMELTFDDTLEEPVVLPARFPNLLANGSEGIAVGIATSIPPHNLRELVNAICYRIKHPSCPIEKLLEFVPGPDFPTGGTIYPSDSLNDIYLTGRGKVTVESKWEITKNEDDVDQIIVSEIPYRVNKSLLIKSIDKIRHDKTIQGIDEVRDESDKDGLRIAIDIKEGASPRAIAEYLLSKTQLRTSYSAHIVAIDEGRPRTLNLADYCDSYIHHELTVISRRSKFLLNKCQARLEIVSGLIKAVSVLDEVIRIIRQSNDKADSKKNLQAAFGFSVEQSEAIVMMPLYRLSHTDIVTLEKEKADLESQIAELNELLDNESKREDLIISDLKKIAKVYGDDRRTVVSEEQENSSSLDKRALITREEVYLVITRDGYIKRSSLKSFKGSGGHNGSKPGIKNGDVFIYSGLVETTDYAIVLTNKGNYLYIPVNEVKETKWNDEGGHVNALVSLSPEEKLIKAFGVKEFRKDIYLVSLSKNGYIKRVPLSTLPLSRRKKPAALMRLAPGDELVGAVITSGNSNLLVASRDLVSSKEASSYIGGLFYNENDIPITNPRTNGVKAGNFKGKALYGLLSFLPEEGGKIMLLTDLGYKRIITLSRIPLSRRMLVSSPLVECFKGEPHALVYLDKVGNKEAPYTVEALLNDNERLDIVFEDFYISEEKNAKRPPSFPRKKKILFVSQEDGLRVDEKTVSFPVPVEEEADAPEIEEKAPELSEIKDEGSDFEQISLFDDLLEED